MKKLRWMIPIILLIISIVPVSAEAPELTARYAYVYDKTTDQALYDKNSEHKLYPASMTKAVTAYVAITKIKDLDAKVRISAYDVKDWLKKEASVAGFKEGDEVTYRDLLYGALYPSGADACRALAVNTCGSERAFVTQMNALMKKLSCTNTHFMNPSGLHHKNHYTTCRDLVTFLDTALQNEDFAKVFNGRKYKTTNGMSFVCSLIHYYNITGITSPLIKGAKSGFTDEAGRCLLSDIDAHGHTIYMVSAKCTTKVTDANVRDTNKLAQYVNNDLIPIKVVTQGQMINQFKLGYLIPEHYDYLLPNDVELLVDKTHKDTDYTYTFEGIGTITSTINKGDKLGVLHINYKDKEVKALELKATDTIVFSSAKLYLEYGAVILVIAGIICVIVLLRKSKKNRESSQEG